MISIPGIYNISLEKYHSDPCETPSLSRSTIIDLINRSPAHAWQHHPKLNPNYQKEESKEKFDLGQATHSLLLQGEDIVSVVKADDWRTKLAKDLRDKARAEGKVPLLLHQYEVAKVMVDRAKEQILACKELEISDLQKDGAPEMSYFWQEDGGAWCRVRPDWVRNDNILILDYKTTEGSANPSDVARLIANFGYDVQDTFYSQGVNAIHGGPNPKFIFVFQETQEPYLCSFVGLPPEFLELGRQKTDFGIFLWRDCMETGKWPAYPDRVCWVEPLTWVFAAWEKRATELGVGG